MSHTVNGKVLCGERCISRRRIQQAMQIIVDPISQAKVGKTVITANIFADVGVRRPNLFVVSTDSGAQ